MVSDGTNVNHDSKSDYDQTFRLLEGSGIKMLGDHEEYGEVYDLYDANQIRVGRVSFGKDDDFLMAEWYGRVFVSGRATSKRRAFNEFVAEVERMHG